MILKQIQYSLNNLQQKINSLEKDQLTLPINFAQKLSVVHDIDTTFEKIISEIKYVQEQVIKSVMTNPLTQQLSIQQLHVNEISYAIKRRCVHEKANIKPLNISRQLNLIDQQTQMRSLKDIDFTPNVPLVKEQIEKSLNKIKSYCEERLSVPKSTIYNVDLPILKSENQTNDKVLYNEKISQNVFFTINYDPAQMQLKLKRIQNGQYYTLSVLNLNKDLKLQRTLIYKDKSDSKVYYLNDEFEFLIFRIVNNSQLRVVKKMDTWKQYVNLDKKVKYSWKYETIIVEKLFSSKQIQQFKIPQSGKSEKKYYEAMAVNQEKQILLLAKTDSQMYLNLKSNGKIQGVLKIGNYQAKNYHDFHYVIYKENQISIAVKWENYNYRLQYDVHFFEDNLNNELQQKSGFISLNSIRPLVTNFSKDQKLAIVFHSQGSNVVNLLQENDSETIDTLKNVLSKAYLGMFANGVLAKGDNQNDSILLNKQKVFKA